MMMKLSLPLLNILLATVFSQVNADTVEPSFAPFSSPSGSPSYSAMPSTKLSSKPSVSASMNPSPQPTPTPSASPSSNPTQSCRDNPSFRRNSVEKKSCNWIGQTNDRRSNNCSIQSVIDNCPQACRLCCDDDEDFRLKVKGGELKQCQWISQKEERQKKYCGKIVGKNAANNAGALITNKCGESCGRCAAP